MKTNTEVKTTFEAREFKTGTPCNQCDIKAHITVTNLSEEVDIIFNKGFDVALVTMHTSKLREFKDVLNELLDEVLEELESKDLRDKRYNSGDIGFPVLD